MKISILFVLVILFAGCGNDNSTVKVNASGQTVLERVKAPKGYDWIIEDSASFGEFLQNTKLKEAGSPVLDFGKNQSVISPNM